MLHLLSFRVACHSSSVLNTGMVGLALAVPVRRPFIASERALVAAVVGYGGEEGKTGLRIWVGALLHTGKGRPLDGGRPFVLRAEESLRCRHHQLPRPG